MGMAASQARYLSLSARKTNVEFEGQQINQARTALSNQSANLWNQQLAMSVPTCPNITDYTKVQYSFNDGYNTYVISNLQSVDVMDKETGIRYNKQVTYYYNQDIFKGVQYKNSNPQVQWIAEDYYYTNNAAGTEGSVKKDGTKWKIMYDGAEIVIDPDHPELGGKVNEITDENDERYIHYLKANNLTSLDTEHGEKLYEFKYTDPTDPDKTITVYQRSSIIDKKEDGEYFVTQDIDNNPHYMIGNSSAKLYDPSDPEQEAGLDQIRHDFPKEKIAGADDTQIWVFTKNGQVYYATKEELGECIASGNAKTDQFQISSGIDYQTALNQYYTGTISERVENTEYAIMDDASGSGRYANIKLQSMSEAFEVKSEEVSNEEAYNDAMNQYNYNVTCYEKALADINAKTSIIHEQDRQLELRLKQLDTEQNALKNEMDAVKSIIKDNVDKTFKTFSG